MKLLKEGILLSDSSTAALYHSRGLVDCKATALMLTTFAELINTGFTINNQIGFSNESQVIWAEINSIPVGGICFTFRQDMLMAWINFSFTDPGYRGLGINAVCHTALEDIAKIAGLTTIASHVHINNTSRIQSCKKVGMESNFYRMSKTI